MCHRGFKLRGEGSA